MACSALSDRKHRLSVRQKLCGSLFVTIFFFTTPAGGQNFFPPGVFYPDNLKVDSYKAKWYTEQLTALQEPSLFEARQDSSVQSYRFLWLRTFDHPVAVRVLIHSDGSGTLFTKMADGAGGYKAGSLTLNKTEPLTPERVKYVVEKIQRLKYWMLPLRDTNTNGRDGAKWIIGGIDHGKYRLVDRWSPKDSPVRELGLYFLRDLAHLHLKADETY